MFKGGSKYVLFSEKVFILDTEVKLEPLQRSNDMKCSAADSIDLHNGDASFGMQNEPGLYNFIFLVDGRFTKKKDLKPRWCSFIHDEYDVFSYHMMLPEKERKGIDMDELMEPYKDKSSGTSGRDLFKLIFDNGNTKIYEVTVAQKEKESDDIKWL